MEAKMIKDEQISDYKVISGGHEKSIPCMMVLRLMDTDKCANDYCKALKLTHEIFPQVNIADLEEELEKYI